MTLHLTSSCRFLADLTGLSIVPISKKQDLKKFFDTLTFYPQKRALTAATLNSLFSTLAVNDLLVVTDVFQVHFIFTKIADTKVIFGPFCSKLLTQAECSILLKKASIETTLTQNLTVYRNTLPVYSLDQVIHFVTTLIKNTQSSKWTGNIKHLDYGAANSSVAAPLSVKKEDITFIRQRYQYETDLMTHIEAGNRNAAITTWHALHKAAAHLNPLGQTLENARVSAAITRTTIRLAATRAGLPADLNDHITGKSRRIINHAHTIDEINQEHERLIQEYCTLIHDYQTKSYSILTLSILYYLQHSYMKQIRFSNLAQELDVTPDYLTKRFHREFKMTPSQYLRKLRMHKASQLLKYTKLPIQTISERVGVLDANYFMKNFRQEYKETPTFYRKHHQG
ncbi:helix-turn-helix transcriptional regulator [Liquorilactobacillus satsumensis]|uniref:helix-turn-helix transcriptional regulator n=1 Tax=Liquorilactobacillus satsumensis TaxID=259059 RepID=UPI0039E91219